MRMRVKRVRDSVESERKNKHLDNKYHINNLKREPKRHNISYSDSDPSPDKLPCSDKLPIMHPTSNTNSALVQQSEEHSEQCNLNQILTNSDTRTTSYNVPTRNRYQILQKDKEADMDTNDDDGDHNNKGKKLPPPIILHGQSSSHKQLVNEIKNHIKGEFTIKYTRNNVNLTISDSNERDKYATYLKNHHVPFHTYTDKNNKTHAFVVRGLASDVEPEELGNYIQNEHNIKVINCYKMKFNQKDGQQQYTPNTLFLLITDNTVTLRIISTEIKFVLHTRVYFELRRNNRRITQCHNCQLWGHATRNCFARTKCLFCAENHTTQSCKQKNKLKCANCQGNHQANDTNCQHYTQRIKWIENNTSQRNNQTRRGRINIKNVTTRDSSRRPSRRKTPGHNDRNNNKPLHHDNQNTNETPNKDNITSNVPKPPSQPADQPPIPGSHLRHSNSTRTQTRSTN